jgi:hypothetical protein
VIGLDHFRRADPAFGQRHLVIHELFLPHRPIWGGAWELLRLLRGGRGGGGGRLAGPPRGAVRQVPAALAFLRQQVSDVYGNVPV